MHSVAPSSNKYSLISSASVLSSSTVVRTGIVDLDDVERAKRVLYNGFVVRDIRVRVTVRQVIVHYFPLFFALVLRSMRFQLAERHNCYAAASHTATCSRLLAPTISAQRVTGKLANFFESAEL